MYTSRHLAFVESDAAMPQKGRARANLALQAATRLIFVALVLGQLLLAVTIALFYGGAAAHGDLAGWNRLMTHGYVVGDMLGNMAVALHLLTTVLVIAGGALQLVPAVRKRYPVFHRWVGRVYVLSAFTLCLAGLYMMWVRGSFGSLTAHIAQSIVAVLIMSSAVMTMRTAMQRDFATHRRWALRLYVLMSSALFIRGGTDLGSMLLSTSLESFFAILSFAQFVIPLLMLEMYLRTTSQSSVARKWAVAGGLFFFTVMIGAGITASTSREWSPLLKLSFSNQRLLAEQLQITFQTNGIDATLDQYRAIKADPASGYRTGEGELNRLGYKLITANNLPAAIRVFQENVAAFPQSGNAYDSLAEAYMMAGDKAQAIANYRMSLRLQPDNRNAESLIKKLESGQ